MTDALPQGLLTGPKEWAQAIRAVCQEAHRLQWRALWLADDQFDGWPLGEAAVVAALSEWALGGGHLRLLARDFASLARQSPRFVQWRQTFDHRLEARVLPRSFAQEIRVAVWSPDWSMVAVSRDQWRAVASRDAADCAQSREWWDSAWPMGSPGFPATTLGLSG